jgi:tRNA(Ile)-lysidine synthase
MVKKVPQPQTPKEKVLAFIRENHLLKGGEKLVAAVSGGPDSVCLLHILCSLRRELGITLHVAHLDHQLRGAESDADAAYVKALARRLKIPATIESAGVQAYRKQHRLTLEEAAREVRYRFLASTVQKTGAAAVAVAHHSNDSAETILMHLIRGTGIKGLRGLSPVTGLKIDGKELTVIRPLLVLSREEITAYCAEHGLKPRTDSSNLSIEPFRNKVRRKLLPELQKYNPRIADALLRTARSAAADLDFIEKAAILAAPEVAVFEKSSVIISKKAFIALHPALQRQVLRDAIESLLGNLKDIESSHIEDVMEALGKPAGKTMGLPFGLNFFIDYNKYILTLNIPAPCPLPPLEKKFPLAVPGITTSNGWEITASYVPSTVSVTEESGFTAYFDAVAAGKKLVVRSCLPGDRIQPLGMTQEKKINRLMMDEKIPRAWRGRVPLVCSGTDIIWVAGWRISQLYRVTPDTKKVLKLEFKALP